LNPSAAIAMTYELTKKGHRKTLSPNPAVERTCAKAAQSAHFYVEGHLFQRNKDRFGSISARQ
jgi:hypothetical protein